MAPVRPILPSAMSRPSWYRVWFYVQRAIGEGQRWACWQDYLIDAVDLERSDLLATVRNEYVNKLDDGAASENAPSLVLRARLFQEKHVRELMRFLQLGDMGDCETTPMQWWKDLQLYRLAKYFGVSELVHALFRKHDYYYSERTRGMTSFDGDTSCPCSTCSSADEEWPWHPQGR